MLLLNTTATLCHHLIHALKANHKVFTAIALTLRSEGYSFVKSVRMVM